MSKQINHEPILPTRAFVQMTISILQGELRCWEGDEPTQEDLDRIVGELGYAQQQLMKRLGDPGIRCACGARMEQRAANGLHCPHCGFYRRMTDEEYEAEQQKRQAIRESNRRISQPDLKPSQGVICQVIGCKEGNAELCGEGCGAWLCENHRALRYHAYNLKQRVGSMYAEPNHLPIWAEE